MPTWWEPGPRVSIEAQQAPLQIQETGLLALGKFCSRTVVPERVRGDFLCNGQPCDPRHHAVPPHLDPLPFDVSQNPFEETGLLRQQLA